MNTETNYLSCAETAKLVRAALKESFPGVKFAVRSSTYSGGASIDIKWTDGPTAAQVESVTDQFEGSYFDGMIDYKGSRHHYLDGYPVRFGANFVHTQHEHSDALIARAIDAVSRAYGGNTPITVEEYRKGGALGWRNSGYCYLGRALTLWLSGRSDIDSLVPYAGMEPKPSATLDRVRFAGDDGYGAGTVGRAGSTDGGEQAYKAISATLERNAQLRKLGLA
jgi:hypothetical protein